MIKLPKFDALYLFISRLSRREKIILYITAVVLALLILMKLIVEPIYSNIKSLDREIVDRESQIKSDMKIVARKDRIRAETKTYTSYVTVPASEDEAMTALLKEIEGLANKSQVYVVDIKPGGVREADSAKKYMVSITCEGKMEQITDFLYAIESSNKLFKVERYQISPKSAESTTAQVSMTISQAVVP